jgi:phosphatidylserine decarboxylase
MLEEKRPSCIERAADLVGLNRWFLRRREIRTDGAPTLIISPCDSVVDRVASIDRNGVVEEKTLWGRQRVIPASDLLKGVPFPESFHGGIYVKQYLSPLNLHYLVFPVSGKILRRERIPGSCFPICLMRTADLRNERMVFVIETRFGFPIIEVLIGSWMVSAIRSDVRVGKDYERGDDLGRFRIGSTVVQLFPKDTVRLLVKIGDRTPIGTPLAEVCSSSRS